MADAKMNRPISVYTDAFVNSWGVIEKYLLLTYASNSN